MAGAAAALGVLARGDGTFVTVTSARGEVYEMATSGVYEWSAKQLVAEGIGWDVFTLAIAAPVMLIAAALVARGSFRGHLLAAGMLGYFIYLYLEYAITWAFGPIFVLFVAILTASIVGLVGVVASLATMGIGERFDERFPRRAWAGLSIGMVLLLLVMWAGRIAQALSGDVAGLLNGGATLTVQALDLGLMAPITAVVAVAALRRRPAGLAAAAAWAVTFVSMSAAIASMMVSASIVTGELQLPPIVIFGLATLGGLLIGARMYASAIPRADDSRARVGSARPADLPAAG
jgi:hypothetical protein